VGTRRKRNICKAGTRKLVGNKKNENIASGAGGNKEK
jgi:hypothetical protein